MTQKQILQDEFLSNPNSVDIESEEFSSLPPEVKHEILTDMKELTKRRRTLFEAMPEDSNDFSQYQLKGLLKKNSLSRCIDTVRKEMNQQYSGEVQAQFEAEGGFMKEVETRRLVSEDTSHYILIKGIQSKKEDKKEESTSTQRMSSSCNDIAPKTYLDLKLASAHKSKRADDRSAKAAPPSPRTLFAIQEAMMEDSLEEEIDDKQVLYSYGKPSASVIAGEGNVSPRTLQAIHQALAEDQSSYKKKMDVLSDEEEELAREYPTAKVIVISSSDEEEKDLDIQGGVAIAPDLSLTNTEFTASSTLCQNSSGNKESVFIAIPNPKEDESSKEFDTVEVDGVNLNQQSVSGVKGDLLYDLAKTVASSVISHSSIASTSAVTMETTYPGAPVMPRLIVETRNPDISVKSIITNKTNNLDSSTVFTTTVDTSKLDSSEKPVVEIETGKVETSLKPFISLESGIASTPYVSDSIMVSSAKSTVSSVILESGKPHLVNLASKTAEYNEPKENRSQNIEALCSNDADTMYVPMTPESIDICEGESSRNEDMESDSDGSFIEVDNDLSAGNSQLEVSKAANQAQETTAKLPIAEASPSNTPGSSGSNTHSSFKDDDDGKDVQPALFQEAEDSGDKEATVNEWQDISLEDLETLEKNLFVEQTSLQAQRQQQERIAATVTGQMCLESQELLRLFGVPYLVAPMEAEAQCAVLELTDQTSGTITDDSDIWLFGARHVYKNFFSQNKYVEYYQLIDLQNQLGLDRSRLINLAYLLGSDYTDGIPTVGYVSAMEILNEFPGPGMEPLRMFKEWWAEAQKNKKIRPNPHDTKVKKKLRELQLHPGFPNQAVADAYLKPVVDESNGAFSWGKPDLEQIREFCVSRFGWYRSKTDEVLLPVLKQLNAQQTQQRIDSFFRIEQHEAQAIKSQRLRRAVTCMKRKERGDAEEAEEATALMKRESTARKPRKGRNAKTDDPKTQGGKRKRAAKELQEHNDIVSGGGFIDGELGALSPNKFSSDESDREAEVASTSQNTAKEIRKTSEEKKVSSPKKFEKVGSSSSSGDEEKTVLVTARPVFRGKKVKSRNVRGRKK
ncbi:hypothetical protein FKM82_009059 [Ascaphus truei]